MNQNEHGMEYDPEEYNKKILEQAALTFSAEGTSKDLKGFLQKRITHNRIIMNNLTQMMDLTLNSSSKKVRDAAYEKEGPLWVLLNHAVKEIMRTDDMLDSVLFHVIQKEFNPTGAVKKDDPENSEKTENKE